MARASLLVVLILICHGCTGSGSDANADGGNDCGYADATNDPQCPAKYSDVCTPSAQTCSSPGLACAYPGAGDGPDPGGCFATAMAWCKVPLGADGGTTKWICAQ
jgi:hypothetical protein